MRIDDEDVQFHVMHHERVDTSVRLILEGWHFDQVDASSLRQVVINVLPGDAMIKSRRTLLRHTGHALKVVSKTVAFYAWSEAFVRERAATWRPVSFSPPRANSASTSVAVRTLSWFFADGQLRRAVACRQRRQWDQFSA